MAGRALGVLLAVAALGAATARAADDDKTQPWKCFRTCARGCHHHHDNGSSATVADFPSGDVANVFAVSAECKNGCQEDACFKDLPAISDTQCAMATCLSHPHHNKKKTACLKDCCEKCFRNSPPAPGPPTPGPPSPGPPTPGPGPKPPSPPN
ncbi:unnamed protein product [Miscanthus lutarioriparius]|uniref:Uncharacterized protein n=1 Tax=Miscanthus lutarioriparius TaxID=422564 RepID=A0A811P2H4_9POAL|nr:unnamed protein product [Miscanthus lutarioriparius]